MVGGAFALREGSVRKRDLGLAVVDQIEQEEIHHINENGGRTDHQITEGDGDIGESAALRHVGTDHTVRQQQTHGHAVQYVHGNELFAFGDQSTSSILDLR